MRALLILPALAACATQPPRQAAACPGGAPTSFGCANTANLRAMAAADDLARGRPLAPADGGAEAAAVERYRADAVKEYRGGTPTDIARGAGGNP